MFRFAKKEKAAPLCDKRLQHIAFIMDGNGRWAKKRGLPREFGHKAGAETFKKILRHCGDVGIGTVTVYAFSTENWSRPENEVNALMRLLRSFLPLYAEEPDVQVRFLGDLTVLPEDLRDCCRDVEEKSAGRPLHLNIALNYGGRDELVHAVNALIQEGVAEVTREDLAAHLYTAGQPDPDIVVRTGGDYRISNFLLWQSAYAEYFFTPTLWPDLTEKEVDSIINAFYGRHRRFGGL